MGARTLCRREYHFFLNQTIYLVFYLIYFPLLVCLCSTDYREDAQRSALWYFSAGINIKYNTASPLILEGSSYAVSSYKNFQVIPTKFFLLRLVHEFYSLLSNIKQGDKNFSVTRDSTCLCFYFWAKIFKVPKWA